MTPKRDQHVTFHYGVNILLRIKTVNENKENHRPLDIV